MITLDRLANVLGSYGGRLRCHPRGRDVQLRDVAVHDPAEPHYAGGDVLLAVGVTEAGQALRLAEHACATVVAIRTVHEPDETVLAGARERGIAVLTVDTSISWSQLAAVVYGLVLEGTETEAGRGPTDLFTLADTLARAVGAAVTVEDRHSRVLAYSSSQRGADKARTDTILGRTVPDTIRARLAEQGVFEHIARYDEPLFVPASAEAGLAGRVVIAVRAGRELLGSIWVEATAPLAEAERRAIREGADTAALHMLRLRASADLERQVESDCVSRLLNGDTDTLALLGRLGLRNDPATPFRVLALRASGRGAEHGVALLAYERATLGFGWARPGRSALFGDTVYTIMPGDDLPRARAWIGELVTDLPDGITTTVGIGGPAWADELPQARGEADESMAVHALRHGSGPPVCYDESWHEIVLQRVRSAARSGREPSHGPLATLRTHDAQHGTSLVPTLHAWLRAQGDLGAAATELGVHRNTVRNRVRQLGELAEPGLDDPDQRLALLITLTAWRH